MQCCIDCFKDTDLRERIRSLNQLGQCDIHPEHSREHQVYTLTISDVNDPASMASTIAADLEEIVGLYPPVAEISQELSSGRRHTLVDSLRDDWDIFNLNATEIGDLIEILLAHFKAENPVLFEDPVVPAVMLDPQARATKALLGGKHWQDFERQIRETNRFHSNLFHDERFMPYLRELHDIIPARTRFFRARIVGWHADLADSEIGMPPAGMAGSGRLNAVGISNLYLASEKDVTFTEIKAAMRDRIAYGEFEVVAPLTVINLEKIARISPFRLEDKTAYLLDHADLRAIDAALRKPSSGERSEVEYVPTQYISDLIKNIDVIDGIYFGSTLKSGAMDLVLFSEDKVELIHPIHYAQVKHTDLDVEDEPIR